MSPRPRPAARLVAVVVAFLAVVTACGADESAEPLPMDAVLIELFGTDDLDRHRRLARRQTATLIADCMAEQGWVYEIAPSWRVPLSDDDPTTLEYAETEGFGIVADFERLVEFENGAGLSGRDPNRGYLETLTADEIGRYLDALGDSESGCSGAAGDEAFADWNAFLAELPWFSGLAEEIDTNPVTFAARERWQVCMAEAGRGDFREPVDIADDVRARLNEALTGGVAGQELVVTTDVGYALSPEARAVVDELGAYERAIAVDNHRCLEPDRAAVREAEREIQQTFVDANREAIDRLLTRAGS